MKRPAPDDSFDDDDDILYEFAVSNDKPSTSTAPPPTRPPPPKQAFAVRPSEPIQLNTFNNVRPRNAVPRAAGQNGNQFTTSYPPRPVAPSQVQAAINQPYSTTLLQTLQKHQSESRPATVSSNPPRPTGFQNQPRPSQSAQLQRSTSFHNASRPNFVSQNQPRPNSSNQNPTQRFQRPNNPQVHPSQPHFHQAFRPPGGPFPQPPNTVRAVIPRSSNQASTPSSSQFQRTVSLPGLNNNGTQNPTKGEASNPRPVAPRTNSQFPCIPTREQVLQRRAMAPTQEQHQRFYGPSQQQRFQRPMGSQMINPFRAPGSSQVPPRQPPRPWKPINSQMMPAPSTGQRPMGPPIQRPMNRSVQNTQRHPFPGQGNANTVPQSQSPFSIKSNSSTSSQRPTNEEEVKQLKGAIKFWEVRYKSKDRDHNLLAFKLSSEMTTRRELASEMERLRLEHEELNQQFLKEQREIANLKSALEQAKAAAARARKLSEKSESEIRVSDAEKEKVPPPVKAQATGQQQPTVSEAEDRVAENPKPDDVAESTRMYDPGDFLNCLSYRKDMDFFFQCPDFKKPDVNLQEVFEKYRTFFNLGASKRDANGQIIPYPTIGFYTIPSQEGDNELSETSQPSSQVSSVHESPENEIEEEPREPTPVPHERMTRTNLRVPPSFVIRIPKKQHPTPYPRKEEGLPVETDNEKKQRETKEREQVEKKKREEMLKARARRKLLKSNLRAPSAAEVESPPPSPEVPAWTPILSLAEMAKPRILRPYERKELEEKKAREEAEAKARAEAEAAEAKAQSEAEAAAKEQKKVAENPVQPMEVDPPQQNDDSIVILD